MAVLKDPNGHSTLKTWELGLLGESELTAKLHGDDNQSVHLRD